MSFNKVITKLI